MTEFIFQSLLTLLLVLNDHLYFPLNLVVSDIFPDVLKANATVWCRSTSTDDLLIWTHPSGGTSALVHVHTPPLSCADGTRVWESRQVRCVVSSLELFVKSDTKAALASELTWPAPFSLSGSSRRALSTGRLHSEPTFELRNHFLSVKC